MTVPSSTQPRTAVSRGRARRVGHRGLVVLLAACTALGALLTFAPLASAASGRAKARGAAGHKTLVHKKKAKPRSLFPVTFALPGASVDWGFLYLANRAGYFRDNGIKVTFDTVSVPAIVPGLVSGTFQATPLTGTVLRAALGGAPGISSVAQLAGKTIVTSPVGSSPYVTLKQLLVKAGVFGKVNILSLGTETAQETAFISGQAQAIFLSFDNVVTAVSKVRGAKILVTPLQAGPTGGYSGLAVSRSFLVQHGTVVLGLIKSILEGVKLVLTQPARTEKLIQSLFGYTKAQAKLLYNDIIHVYQLNPVPTKAELANDAALTSLSTGKSLSEADIASFWSTTMAARAYKELGCPKLCAPRRS